MMMRIFLLLSVMFTALLHADQTTEVFQVSKAGKDKEKLMNIFHQIQVKEAGKRANLEVYHVVKRLNTKRFIVHPMKDAENPLSPLAKPDFARSYLLETAHDRNVAEKGKLIVMKPELTGNEYTYQDQYGAKISVRILKVEPDPDEEPLLTQAQFIKALRDGQTWTLNEYAVKRCFECFGKGNSGPLKGNIPCKPCEGLGKVTVSCEVMW